MGYLTILPLVKALAEERTKKSGKAGEENVTCGRCGERSSADYCGDCLQFYLAVTAAYLKVLDVA